MYSQKLGAGLSARSVEIIHAVLHKALKRAVRWALVPRNIAEAVTPPRPTTAAGDNAPANHSAGFICVVTNVELVSSSGDLYATYNGQSVLLPQTPRRLTPT